MTSLDVHIDGRGHRIGFETAGNRLKVVVDGREHLVDERAVEGAVYSLLIGAFSFEVTVEETSEGYKVQVETETVQALKGSALPAEGRPGGTGASGPVRIRSVMPGKVVRVLVKSGQVVNEGQPLLVLEAMKMENEVLAPAAGKVSELLVEPGDAVERGAGLVVLD